MIKKFKKEVIVILTYEGKKEIIADLGKALNCDFGEKKSRYNADTNTLSSSIHGTGKVEEVNEKTIKKLEIPLEEEEYRKMLNHEMNFYIAPRNGYILGRDVTFREHKNFKTTGRICVKTISQIVYGTPDGPIKEGYCVFGWR